MASYQRNPMFGQDFSLTSLFDYGAGGTDAPSSAPSAVPITAESEGSGASSGWFNVISGALGLGTAITNAVAGQQPVAATPGVPTRAVVPSPGLSAGLGGASSSILLIGGLGVLALLLLKK